MMFNCYFMKPVNIIFAFFLMLFSCDKKSNKSFSIEKKSILTDTIAHSNFVDSVGIDSEKFLSIKEELYKEKKINSLAVLKKIDSLIKQYSENYKKTNFSYNINKIEDLHFLKGVIFYEKSDFQNALKEFSFDTIESFTIARAATYIKLNQYDKALQNIKSQGNFEDKWYMANYYEVIGKIDSAKILYKEVENRYPEYEVGKNCTKRLNELNRKKPKLLKELQLPKRK